MNSKSKKVYCFSLPKRKKPYRKSIHIYKKVLDKPLHGGEFIFFHVFRITHFNELANIKLIISQNSSILCVALSTSLTSNINYFKPLKASVLINK